MTKKTKVLFCLQCGIPVEVGVNAKSVLCKQHKEERYPKRQKEYNERKIVIETDPRITFEHNLGKSFPPKLKIPVVDDFPRLKKIVGVGT